ncbi:MAG: chemotaxis protein methyltransferase CheR [Thermodesulfobacteriota bacterium]|nr:chemotaxis protein methyltransferase CheR [Thermodesulfobacteriota bacterium]
MGVTPMHDLDDVVRVIARTLDQDISKYDEHFLQKSVERRLGRIPYTSLASYLRRLSEDKTEAETFFRSLNITYSEFFRNRLTYAYLEQAILPRLIEKKEKDNYSELRIWSTSCAAGQEAYSLAILVEELVTRTGAEIPTRIFATDTSEADLEIARKGVYDTRAVGNVTLKHLNTYFSRQDGTYVVVSRLRERIDFSSYDLLDDGSWCPPASIFGDFDLVMCCNLLFYYRKDIREFILSKVIRCLKNDGYLVTGEVERVIVEQTAAFQTLMVPAAVFQRTNRRDLP